MGVSQNEQAALESLNNFAGAGMHMLFIMGMTLIILVKLARGIYIGASINIVFTVVAHFIMEQFSISRLGEAEYLILFFYGACFALIALVVFMGGSELEKEEE